MKPILRPMVAASLTLVGVVSALDASASVFTDRSSFNAAAGSVAIETFESSPLVGTTGSGAVSSINFTDFSVSSDPPATKVIDADHFAGSFNTTPGGKNYLYFDTDVGLLGTTATFGFNSVTHAIGFDYTGFNEPSSTFNLTIEGTTYALTPNADNNSFGFWGYTSATGFTSFTFSTSTDSGYSFDQVTYTAAVPEPETYAMLLAGLGLLGFTARRRKQNAV